MILNNLITPSISLVEFHDYEIGDEVFVFGYDQNLNHNNFGVAKILKIAENGEKIILNMGGQTIPSSPLGIKRTNYSLLAGDWVLTRNGDCGIVLNNEQVKNSCWGRVSLYFPRKAKFEKWAESNVRKEKI